MVAVFDGKPHMFPVSSGNWITSNGLSNSIFRLMFAGIDINGASRLIKFGSCICNRFARFSRFSARSTFNPRSMSLMPSVSLSMINSPLIFTLSRLMVGMVISSTSSTWKSNVPPIVTSMSSAVSEVTYVSLVASVTSRTISPDDNLSAIPRPSINVRSISMLSRAYVQLSPTDHVGADNETGS